ncbi:hypothetical protein [Chryseobacterium caseinilyticum]|uniref:hypothetical protein n=1 Tax=Chryseobacterium caseinilyticum TaxID=2771428 RepID=UPI00178279E8|nr:hypothetical protein [Chryseobacterium caseinilyticum]
MQRVKKHINNVVSLLDLILKSGFWRRAFTTVFIIFCANSFAQAQIYVEGGATIVNREQICSNIKITEKGENSSAVISVNGEGYLVSSGESVVFKVEKKNNAQVVIKKKVLKTALAFKEKPSNRNQVLPLKKSTVHYKPIDNPDQFTGVKHTHKTLNLPTEHSYKVLGIAEHQSLSVRNFSLEKTRILTAQFFNAHIFSSAFYTRPPPFRV